MVRRLFPKFRQPTAPPVPGARPPGWALKRGTTLVVAAAVCALVAMGALSYRQAQDWAETARLTKHTQAVLAQIGMVHSLLEAIGGTTRGYALTGQQRYLDDFHAHVSGVDAQMAQLQSLTQDNPAQRQQIAPLQQQIAQRIRKAQKVLDTRQSEGLEKAAEMVANGHGENTFKEAVATLDQMRTEELRLLEFREKASVAASRTIFMVLPAGTLVSLLVLALGVLRLNKEAAAARGAHEQATTDLLESTNDGFVAIDRAYRFTRVNSAALELLGKPSEELLGKTVWEAFPEAERLLFGKEFRKALEQNTSVAFEEYYPEPVNRWLEVRAHPAAGDGLNVFFHDITRRKRTELRLRQLSRAVEQSPSVVMITDTQGHIEYVNPKFTELTGYNLEEVRGQNPRLLKASETARHGPQLWATIRAGKEWHGEFCNRKKNGEIYWENALISPIFDDQGSITHFLAVKENITERKSMEASLVEAKRRAEEANRSKDTFLATLSHELRTPLTPVLLTASSAEDDASITGEVREQFRMIRNSIELEARLIDDLLDLTKISRGKFSLNLQPFSASEPLQQTLEILRHEYSSKNLHVEWTREAASTQVCADMARLHQVFWNLLKNAIKFTPPGGEIRIRTFNPGPDTLAVEVRDSGMGIAPEFLAEIFHPFQQGAATGKPQFGGLGLGLAITKAIVEVHGGNIRAASPGLGQGSTFTIEMPLGKNGQEAPAPAHPAETSEAARTNPLRILLVEDDKATRTVLSRLLKKNGHDVVSAGSRAEALEAASAQPAASPFQTLLCDLGLPDGSGLDVIGPVKTLFPGITAIAISGFGMAEDVRRSKEAGFDVHLVKPISIEELRHTLNRVA